MKFFACKAGHITYLWKVNFMLINSCRRTIPWKPMVTALLVSLDDVPLCGEIGQISDILCIIYHWKHNSILINFYYRTMPFKLQIWELQTFLKSLFLFEIGIFCLPVGIKEHLREKYLHLKIKIQRDWTVGLNLYLKTTFFLKLMALSRVFISFKGVHSFPLVEQW